ncbi:2OG-Fe dioxygenase family protein [Brytella acorum]|uniref:2OG-Fe dioxygenase family protein n=1 Tax=Brytella acorum TaxID=2959299 RepID=A0AA35UYS3_9PROT|nr:2OG-Fe dioxygenase family protein [Brytella acorum]CAI9121953.1 2OG-Fe dioxygenase family protein [Brytella acorum]
MSLPTLDNRFDDRRTIDHTLRSVQEAVRAQSYFMAGGQILKEVFQSVSGCGTIALNDFCQSWNDMPVDTYMGDRGVYRRRRHATYRVSNDHRIQKLPHRPHYQTVNYNHLNGGVERHFDPIPDTVADGAVLRALLHFASSVFSALDPVPSWYVEVHQFRIEAVEHGGKPTPEGAHRDGVSFVLMVLIDRHNVTGGETTVYSLSGVPLADFTLQKRFDIALVNDEKVVHGVSPVFPTDGNNVAYRDVLVITFRAERGVREEGACP